MKKILDGFQGDELIRNWVIHALITRTEIESHPARYSLFDFYNLLLSLIYFLVIPGYDYPAENQVRGETRCQKYDQDWQRIWLATESLI